MPISIADERFTRSLSENILTLLCHSDQYGRMILSIITPYMFENEVHQVIAKRTIEYWNLYHHAPGKAHTADLFDDILEDSKNPLRDAFRQVLTGMITLTDAGVNTQYVIAELRTFVKFAAVQRAIIETVDQLESRRHHAVPEVEKIWSKLLSQRHIDLEPGSRLSDIDKALSYLEEREAEFSTGIGPLDENRIIPTRGKAFLFLAPSGYGKSWFAITCGKRAYNDRKKVLHLTLEMEEEECLLRYYQAMFAIPMHERSSVIRKGIERDRDGKFTGFLEKEVTPPFALSKAGSASALQARMDWYGSRIGNLIIKHFPMRSVDVDQIIAYVDQLNMLEGFVPDLLIIDYWGVIKYDQKNKGDDLGRQFQDLKGFLSDKKIAGLIPHQVNRSGMASRNVKLTHVSNDISLTQTADFVVLMSGTDQERDRGLARLYVGKARGVRDHFGVLLTQNYDIGQFCVDSLALGQEYYNHMSITDDDGDDDGET